MGMTAAQAGTASLGIVPMAFIGRTSTATMQDPVESLGKQLRLSRDRGGGERVVTPPPPQHVLAARVGTRRESVSREMAEMVRSGSITVARGAIILHRPEALRAEVDARLQGQESRTTGVTGNANQR